MLGEVAKEFMALTAGLDVDFGTSRIRIPYGRTSSLYAGDNQ